MKKSWAAYGVGAIGHDMFYQTMSVFLINFITEALGLPGKTLGIITAIVVVLRILEMLNDPLMGGVIDNTKSKWGKFKPWQLFGTLISAICVLFLFSDFFGIAYSNRALYIICFIFVYLILDVAFALCDIGYWSMVPALSLKKNERDKITSFARICASIGAALAVVLVVPAKTYFASLFGGNIKTGWFCYVVIVVIIVMTTITVTFFGAKEAESDIRTEEKTTIKGIFKLILSNDQLVWSALFIGLFALGSSITLSFGLYYFKYVYGNESMYTLFAAVVIISQLTVLTLFNFLSNKFTRKQIYAFSLILASIGYIGFFISSKFVFLSISGFCIFGGQGIQQLMFVLVLSDIVEYGQWKTGIRKESTTLAILPMLNKLSGAISNGVVGLTVISVGMVGNNIVTNMHSILIFKMAMMGVPFILVVLALIVFLKKFKIDEKFHEKIMVDLRKRAKK